VRTQTDASTAAEFAMGAAGVYLVKVGDRPARRIVIVRYTSTKKQDNRKGPRPTDWGPFLPFS
jgi:hypothetical protein